MRGGGSYGFSKPALTATRTASGLPGDLPTGRPRVQVEGGDVFDFGVMSPEETRQHVFVVRNTGDATLTLRFLEKSCQCTEARLSRSEIPPGESAEVELSWKSNDYKLEFSQTARFQTNDPSQLELDLRIRGRVQQIVRPVPLALSFDNVLVQQSRQATIQVFGYRDDDLCVEQAEFLVEETAEFFQAAITPLPADVMQREPGARSGSLVTLTLQPGLSLGPLYQRVRLRLNKPDLVPIEVPIEGVIVGNVTIVGSDYDAELGLLKLGMLSAGRQHERQLWVLIKGSDASAIQLRVSETDPAEVLQATLGQPMRAGNLMRQALTVRVVPQGRVVNRLGSQQGETGRIVLESDHPAARKVVIRVAFAVEGSL